MSLQEAYAIADLAYTLYEQGRYKDSQVLCEGLVMGNPHHAYFHTLLAGVYEKQNLTDKAIDEYNVSIFLDPKGISALVNRADLLLKKGRVQQAVEDLRNAMALDPKSETPSGTRARALAAVTAAIMEQVLNK
jgi:tetratricopeptide (TPR) repeat protein